MELEASTIHTPGALSPPRIAIGPRLLRLRSDEQLVALFRTGHDEAFQVIYDRYHKRLEGYARQMLPTGHDAEDALQDVFVRAYRALRADDRQLAVRPWLFRIVHNRCIDELRRLSPTPTDVIEPGLHQTDDPVAQADAREALRRLIEDIRRLPEQQRSALLLRELCGISYAEVAAVLEVSIPAVKSLLVRARMGLVRADAARDTACSEIREELALAHYQGVRASAVARRHLRDCPACRSHRGQMCLVNKRLAAILPVGPVAAWARLIGLSGSGASGTGAAPAAALTTGGAASGTVLGANHVAALIAAAIASAGGAVGLQHAIAPSGHASRPALSHHAHRTARGGRSEAGTAGTSSWASAQATAEAAYAPAGSVGNGGSRNGGPGTRTHSRRRGLANLPADAAATSGTPATMLGPITDGSTGPPSVPPTGTPADSTTGPVTSGSAPVTGSDQGTPTPSSDGGGAASSAASPGGSSATDGSPASGTDSSGSTDQAPGTGMPTGGDPGTAGSAAGDSTGFSPTSSDSSGSPGTP